MTPARPPRRIAPSALPLTIVLCVGPPGAALAAPDPDALLSFTQAHPMLPGVEDRPMVEVFADGRVTVFRDRLRTSPGEHTFELDGAALERLLALAGLGLSTGAVIATGAEAPPAEAARGVSVRAIADPTTSLIGIASTLGRSAFVPPPAPGTGASSVAVSNEEAGLVTFVVEQTPESEAAAAADEARAPAFEPVLSPAGTGVPDTDRAVPGGTISLQVSDAAVVPTDPLRTLEAALIELYLLPDVAVEAGR